MALFVLGVRYLLRRPLQLALCVLGVALGVAMVIAIDLANASASRAFDLSTEAVAGRATHQIVGSGDGLDESVYRRLKVELGIAEAAPVVEGYATALEMDAQPIRVLGVDAFAEAPFRSYLGTGNIAAQAIDLSAFLTRPDAVLISEDAARRYGLNVGSALTLRVGDRRQTMHVVGLLRPEDENSRLTLEGLAIVDISVAQELFDKVGLLSHIDLIADERTPEGRALLERVRSVLPPEAQIVKPQTRSQSVESLTDAFRLNLTALSLLALVVGMFLIYNTVTFSVVQRRPIIGTLRCLGVTRGEVFRQIVIETLLLGLVGSVLGIGLGTLMGRVTVALVTQTINDLYYTVTVRSVALEPFTVVKGIGIGLAASLLAAMLPAYEATRVPPITAMKRAEIEASAARIVPWLALAGALLFAVGTALELISAQLVVNLAGIFLLVIGVALTAPLITVWLMRPLALLLGRLTGVVERMAARSIANAISRTGVAIAALMVAVSVIIGLQSMIGSFRVTVEAWLEESLTADVYVSPPSTVATANAMTIAPEVIVAFQQLPGVHEVTLLRQVQATFITHEGASRTATLLAVESSRERPPSTYVWTLRSPQTLWASMRGRDEVLVSEPFANRFGITPNQNRVRLRTKRGEHIFHVVGVYYDYARDSGVVIMHRDLYRRYFGDDKVSSLALYLDPEQAPTVPELRRLFAGRELVISANRELRANALQIFDRTFAITGALNLLATAVAFIGVLSALMALQIERTRELGVLRANGMTLRQLWRMTLVETGLMGSTAGLLSFPTGILLAVVLVYIINLRSFGWTIRLTLDPQTFAQAMAVAVISALLAGVYPMLRLRALQIADAVRQE
ncbi:MAG: FtsX-like permease family protein [Anaerolineae bacterium]|nr:FtsX-like permease family protein [Anaerolineae bacterium]